MGERKKKAGRQTTIPCPAQAPEVSRMGHQAPMACPSQAADTRLLLLLGIGLTGFLVDLLHPRLIPPPQGLVLAAASVPVFFALVFPGFLIP